MPVIRYSRQARADLIDIWRGLFRLNEMAADRSVDRIESAIRLLRDFPEIGVRRPDIHKEGRVLIIDRWLVFYRTAGNIVFVVRVIDGRRDLTRLDPRARS